MFTGIIEGVGEIIDLERRGEGKVIKVQTEIEGFYIKPGDSISLDGVCLTVVESHRKSFRVFLGKETLEKTKFGRINLIGYKVNIERPLKPDSYISGHLVLGHVDDVAHISGIKTLSSGKEFCFKLRNKKLTKYLVYKGSIALDGVSLTVNEVLDGEFIVFLIPYTLEKTTFKGKKVGDLVNVEVDILAKYLESLINSQREAL